ncbi:hypothetical protein ACFPZ0_12800 [Streptomonospora nanhaiensis]|uniref:Uncharacterized protein n=1 Tax=Streptomonospora nanhaiensis TaxID=1323731 RepID=A0A853BMN5_9ACTN|nr:hypothetical protein [Streptomonospora nanhaiensis]MBV2366653.1 hypothetical protein [Streptomonospora nanhaiensis]MBX9389211.1 hypothetical protein [Streptomonospora nanhaiensis]NYI95846.1 hypothetical protein [Streptomonospora nanhaiensis]
MAEQYYRAETDYFQNLVPVLERVSPELRSQVYRKREDFRRAVKAMRQAAETMADKSAELATQAAKAAPASIPGSCGRWTPGSA